MRSFVLVALSAAALAGLFIVYWTMQPSHGGAARNDESAIVVPPPPHVTGAGVLRPGQEVSLKQYDRNGQLSSRFSADEYIPQRDGTIRVTHPLAEFFLANHQRVEVHGDDGNVVAKDVPRIAENAFTNPGPAAPPSRGRLNHVLINIIDDATKEVLMTMTTDNVVFDNETYRISTEGYRDARGTKIADDQVPVFVTGKKIEMQGKGMIARWNDKDGRLELLEILHGDYLKITDSSSFSPGGSKTTNEKPLAFSAPSPGTPVFGPAFGSEAQARREAQTRRGEASGIGDRPRAGWGEGPLSATLASTDQNAPAQIVNPSLRSSTKPARSGESTTSRVKADPIVYQASFYDNVRINQAAEDGKGDQIRIDNVDRMDVDFLMKQSGPESATKPSPATQPEAATLPPEKAVVADQGHADSVPTTAPTSTTQPVVAKQQPIYVHWTGVLRIAPLKTLLPPVPLKMGDSAVYMVGDPVSVHRTEPRQQGSDDIRCASLLYQTAGEKVWLKPSERFPKIQITKTPAASAKEQSPTHLVSTGAVQYSRDDGKALITGPGSAEIPLQGDQQDKYPTLHAAWTKQAEFDFTQSADRSQPAVSNGHFEGDVDIRHPRFSLRSQLLDLLFDPPTKGANAAVAATEPTDKGTSQPNLREVIATTGVFCQMDSASPKRQMIECNRLALDTAKADGKLYARHVNATGSVHAYGEDDLRAQYVDLLLKPAPKLPPIAGAKPASDDEMARIELEKMVARENVIAKSKDGSVATGDELQVTTEDGRQKTVLTSRTQATVTDAKRNVVKGPEIQFDSQTGRAHIVGPGSLHAIQQASATQPAQPVDVTWQNGAIFDGAANRIDVDGRVLANSVDKRGYVDTAKGDHIRIDLRAKPTTQPAKIRADESPTISGKVASKDSGSGLKMDPFKGKEVSVLTIENDAIVASTLSRAQWRRSSAVRIGRPDDHRERVAPDGSPSRSVTVPSAGRMLSRDHRPPQKSQSSDSQSDSTGARGATAFRWSKKLVYVESAHRADMMGDVFVVHQDDEANALPVKMNCEHVIAWFEQTAKAPSGVAQAKPADEQSAMQLRYLRAEGSRVQIVRDVDQMIARQVDYDPKRHVMIATGTERNPVEFSNGATGGGTAEGVEWDTLSWKMKTTNAIFDYRPPTPPTPAPPKKKPTTKPAK